MLIAGGCALPGSDRTFRVGEVTVVDESGLVTGATAGAPEPDSGERPLAQSPGSLTEVAVYWTDAACVDEWTLRLAGNALRMTLEPGDPVECSAGVDRDHAITLRLNRVIEADDIEVEQLGE